MTRRHTTPALRSQRSHTKAASATQPAFELVIERLIDAPPEQVFAAWTKPDSLTAWFAPRPYRLIIHKMDFRLNGVLRMAMRGPGGQDSPFLGRYREIAAPSLLSWDSGFAGASHDQISTLVTFQEQGAKTRVHVRQTFHVMTRQLRHAAKGARQGWGKTLAQLAAFCRQAMADRIDQRIELRAPVWRVWRALTDPQEFGEWFRVRLDGPFVPGQACRGRLTYPGYEGVKWEAFIKDMEPERRFSYTWHPYAIDPTRDYSQETPTLVEFRLKATAAGTLLSVSESGFDGISSARRQEAYRMHEAGWSEQLRNVKAFLAKRPQEPPAEAGQKIMPCLWFADRAEEAAQFYVSVFKDAKVLGVARYGKAGAKASGRPEGSVMTVSFQLEGQPFLALNGGPLFAFSQAISLVVKCRTQEDIDALWNRLSADPDAERCGWIKDKFGVSWQIVPAALDRMMRDKDERRSEKVMAALVQMQKLDLKALQTAFAG